MSTVSLPPGQARTSELLEDFASRLDGERVRLGDLVSLLGNRSFGILLLLFAMPNLVPLPPGSSTVFGIPLMLVSLQMMLGWPTPWMPRWALERSIARNVFVGMLDKVLPRIRWLERWLRPRAVQWTGLRAERVLGGYCALQAFVLALPLPLANLPPALTIVLVALGLMERDGLLVMAGCVAGLLSLMIASAVSFTAVKVALTVLGLG